MPKSRIERPIRRKDLDFEVALDLVYGPIFYRLLNGHARLDAAFTDGVLELALGGLSPKAKK